MRRCVLMCVAAASLALAPAATATAGPQGSYVLTATSDHGSAYAPTFTGNGLLGVRVPAAGQGYAGGSVPAQSELAGFYAKPTTPESATSSSGPTSRPGRRCRSRDGGQTFSRPAPAPCRTGASRSTSTPASSPRRRHWTAPRRSRHRSHLPGLHRPGQPARRRGPADRDRRTGPGTATVTDAIDGIPGHADQPGGTRAATPRRARIGSGGQAEGTGIQAAIASQLHDEPQHHRHADRGRRQPADRASASRSTSR